MEFRRFSLAFTLFLLAVALVWTTADASAADPVITSSALDHIVVLPNDRPTRVDISTDQQFVASGYTADGKVLAHITFTWSVGGGIGSITDTGIFTAERGGVGTVIAKSGGVQASVGVVVRGIAPAKKEGVKKQEASSAFGATVAPVTPPATPSAVQEDQAGPTDEAQTPEIEGATDDTQNKEATTQECAPWNPWVWVGILVVYTALLLGYYLSLRQSRTPMWWVLPLLLTVLLLILYVGVRCGMQRPWIPTTLVILGALTSLFYYTLQRPKQSPGTPATPV